MRPQPDTPVDVVRDDLGCHAGCHGQHDADAHVAVHIADQCDDQPDPDDPDVVQADGRWAEVTCISCRVRWRGHLARGGQ